MPSSGGRRNGAAGGGHATAEVAAQTLGAQVGQDRRKAFLPQVGDQIPQLCEPARLRQVDGARGAI